jgi:hypothetical protein
MGLVLTWPVGRGTQESGTARRPAPFGPVAAYALSSGLGGAVTGFVVAYVGAAIRAVSATAGVALLAVAGATALIALVCEWRGRVSPLPERRAQVPRRWLLWRRPTLTAAAFGLVIGSGVLTHLKHAAAYALGAIVLLVPSVGVGALIGATYGLGRGMTLMLTWVGDRFVGRRPPWPQSGRRSIALNRALATTALISLVVALFEAW